eukprot:TRINITY_DN7669_c0_g1_i3.p1 TRINITY_DN7669_c0_g1~~TRINITY_DN7669_c0_g1_i3.p1  ORF type:complete len:296 (+),score=63.48 TRINITY_DN7669_c0_g1_i3:63-950(+)
MCIRDRYMGFHLQRMKFKRRRKNQVEVTSPVEKVLEVLREVQMVIEFDELRQEVVWCIEIISSNLLFEPFLEVDPREQDNVKKNEVADWVNNFSNNVYQPQNENKDMVVLTRRQRRMSVVQLRNEIYAAIPKESIRILEEDLNKNEFDCFALSKDSPGNELAFTMFFLFHKAEYFDLLKINPVIFKNFITKIQNGYRSENPYHNALHATDVVQTVNYLMKKGEFIALASLSHLESCAMYIAAAIHDFDHPGTNNIFQVYTKSLLANRYNGKCENTKIARQFILKCFLGVNRQVSA